MQPMSEFLKSMQESIGLIAQEAGVVVEHLWVVLTKQQFMYGLQGLIKGVVSVIFGLFVAGGWGEFRRQRCRPGIRRRS